KADDDADTAGRPAAERNAFLEMIADRRPPGVVRDRDAHRELPLAEDRLIGPCHRDKIAEIDRVVLGGRGTALTDDHDIELEAQRIARPIALRIDLAKRAIERDTGRLVRLVRPEHG